MALRPAAAAFHSFTALNCRSSNSDSQRSTMLFTDIGSPPWFGLASLGVPPRGGALREERVQALDGVVRRHQALQVKLLDRGKAPLRFVEHARTGGAHRET